MKIINTKNGVLKVNHKLVALLLAGTTTLTLAGCVPKNNKQEVETISTTVVKDLDITVPEVKINEFNTLFQVERTELEVTTSKMTIPTFNTLPKKRKKTLKDQIGNNKVVIHTNLLSPSFEISDIKLKIKDSKGKIVDYVTTTSNGVVLENLNLNEQYTIEIEDTSFYSLESDKVYTFTLKNSNMCKSDEFVTNHIDIYLNWKDKSFKVENPEIRNNWFNISIIDLYNNEYATGGRYAVLDENNQCIMAWTATDEPCRLSNLKDGDYTIIEREPSEDYSTFQKRASITIKNNKIYSKVANKEIESREIIFYVRPLTKTLDDNNSKKLSKIR